MKIRILSNGEKYRLQRKFLWTWRNCDLEGNFYHPEQMIHCGHITVDSIKEAMNYKASIENTTKKKELLWSPIL